MAPPLPPRLAADIFSAALSTLLEADSAIAIRIGCHFATLAIFISAVDKLPCIIHKRAMETNLNADLRAELRDAGKTLLDAAMAFWRIHRRLAGPRAVVWLSGTDGHFVVFTRGEYREQLLRNIEPLSDETPLDFPDPDAKPC